MNGWRTRSTVGSRCSGALSFTWCWETAALRRATRGQRCGCAGDNRAHEFAATLALMSMVTELCGHPKWAADLGHRATEAYAAIDGHVEDQIEAMLAIGKRTVSVV